MPTGCHLVGSVPFHDTQTVPQTCSDGLPGRLKRIPDGETGHRNQFTYFQMFLFPESIRMDLRLDTPSAPKPLRLSLAEIDHGMRLLEEQCRDMQTGYDEAAIDSYGIFKKLKKEGFLPRDIRFQVSVTTLGAVVGAFISPQFQSRAAELYEVALFKALEKIQKHVVHQDLAIQLDMGVDMLYWVDEWAEPWWAKHGKGYLTDYVSRMANQVNSDVELGFHFCYGDMDNKHVVEPESLEGVVTFAQAIFDKCQRHVNFMHCAVPSSAVEKLDGYFKPLEQLIPRLKKGKIELYLGLIHAHNGESTRKMIEAANKVTGDLDYGIATECGWGRTPKENLKSIMDISNAESNPLAEAGLVRPVG